MKYITPFLLTAVIAVSCTSVKKKDAKTVIENYFKAKANDPASYQTVEIKLVDTISDIKSMKLLATDFKKMMSRDSVHKDSAVHNYNSLKAVNPSETALEESKIETAKAVKDFSDDSITIIQIRHQLDSLKNMKSKNNFQLEYLNKIRSKNALGALVLQSYYVYLDDTLGVIKFEEAPNDVLK
jgi:hypothetical protein